MVIGLAVLPFGLFDNWVCSKILSMCSECTGQEISYPIDLGMGNKSHFGFYVSINRFNVFISIHYFPFIDTKYGHQGREMIVIFPQGQHQ